MLRLLWDASGLAKRYVPEVGSATVNALWASVPAAQMATTFPGYAETFSIFLRKRNRGEISAVTFAAAKSAMRREVVNSLEFAVLAVETADVLAGIDLMEKHNINAADSAILAACLRYAQSLSEPCVLVAADTRLLRAAAAEGLAVLNPELLPVADVPAFLLAL